MSDTRLALLRKQKKLQRRRQRVHKKMLGTPERPRLVVFRSNNHIYAQLRDDLNGRTLTGCSTLTPDLKEKVSIVSGKVEKAKLVGEYLGKLAKEKEIIKVIFDRNGRKYHGRVKAVAEGARDSGLEF